ncbi:PR-1-like protein [Ephemerocybe angulata]|uniref:PR-1-like protein n=1 Tax=Ephemerocybe angulata TaxID=980116 RepID=A0A8H6IKI2_9AGAR|nr:PR-1-like protein [Tulosesus angulatus]
MARFAVILAVIISAATFQGAVASPSCAYKYRGKAECIQKCKESWGWTGNLRGSNPWGPVIQKVSAESKLKAETYIAQACGSSVSTTASSTSSSVPVATSSSTVAQTTTVISSPVVTSSTTSSTLKATTTSSSSKATSSSTSASSANVAPTSSSKAPVSSSSVRVASSSSSQPSPTTTTTKVTSSTTTKVTSTAPPTTTSSPPTGGSESTSGGDIQAYLDAHNSVRRNHGAADLTWSDSLAAAAQKWANNCQFKHSGGSLGAFGENLSAGTNMDIAGAVKLWADEAPQYDPSNPQFSHFTQVVWKSTTQVGCAVQTCTGIFGDTPAKFFVCEYNPAGNVGGRFAENVQV